MQAEARVSSRLLHRTLQMLPGEAAGFPRRFGPYVLVRVLAEGGMGRVYLALTGTVEARRLCVIKRVSDDPVAFAQIPELRVRFKREAEIALSLSHATIAQSFTAGQQDGLYLVQEYVHGMTLKQLMSALRTAAEPLPVRVASHVVVQVARALGYLHNFQARGLIHRDVTPENVMLAYSGEVKLIDFGVAKATAWNDGLTQAGAWFGKPNWIAPELLLGHGPDPRADLFSLGLLYWHMLSGKSPGPIQTDPARWPACFVAPSTCHPQVTAELDALVARAISYDPQLRFQTAEELQDAVEACVPVGHAGEKELAVLLARHMNVAQEAALDVQVEEARRLLDHGGGAPSSGTVMGRAHVRPLWLSSLTSAVGLTLLGGLLVLVTVRAQPTAGSPFDPTAVAKAEGCPPAPEPAGSASILPPAMSSPLDPVSPNELTPPPAPPLAPLPALPSAPLPLDPPRSHKLVRVQPQPKPKGQAAPKAAAERALASAREQFERSELTPALSQAEQAARLGAGANAYLLIGRIRALKRDFVGAESAFAEALRLEPDNAEAKRRRERLRSSPSEGPLLVP